MNNEKRIIEKLNQNIKSLYSDFSKMILEDNGDRYVQSVFVFAGVSFVSLYMTIANYFTEYYTLMICTFVFFLLMMVNLIISILHREYLPIFKLFGAVEYIALVSIFIVTGVPEGFSSIWSAIVPVIVFQMYRQSSARVICGFTFVMLSFFFWTSTGNSLLMYEYTSSWMLRFPLFFVGMVMMCDFLITSEIVTGKELALTRNALNEILNEKSEELNKTREELKKHMTHYSIVSTADGKANICHDRLLYIQMIDHYIYYHLLGLEEPIKSKYCRKSFRAEIMPILEENEDIIYCGGGFSINLMHVLSIENKAIEMSNGEKLYLSQNAYTRVIEYMEEREA